MDFLKVISTYDKTIDSILKSVSSNERDNIKQEVLLGLWRARDGFLAADNHRNYVITATKNTIARFFSRLKPLHECFDDPLYTEFPENICDKRELSDRLTKKIKKLSSDQQVIVRAYYYEDKTLREIASEMGVSHQTIKNKLTLIHETLKYLLENTYETNG